MIISILFTPKDSERAERLLDTCHWTGGANHILLAHTADVHPEQRERVKVSAEVAGKTVDVLQVDTVAGQTKVQQQNSAFRQIARHIHTCYREPFLWLEPCCVPLKKDWLKFIELTYAAQPRRYLGAYMQGKTQRFLSRVAVYPNNAINDVDSACQTGNPFHRVIEILPRATNSTLFRIGEWQDGMNLGDAVLLDGDKTGTLIEQVMEGLSVKVLTKTGKGGKVPA